MKQLIELKENYKVAIPEWQPGDGIAKMIEHELLALGHIPERFPFDGVLPEETDILLTFAPYNKVLRVWEQAALRKKTKQLIVIHWNTEGLPDLRIPMFLMMAIGNLRSKVGRMGYSKSVTDRYLYKLPLLNLIDRGMIRFRHLGDYEYAYKMHYLDLLFDSSQIYCHIRSNIGLPTQYAPWGSSSIYYKNLGLTRDIDVLWMGDRGTARRNRNLNYVTKALRDRGFTVYLADNHENPFVFGDERTVILNRSKITLNLTRTWYDDNYSRFSMAAPNRSMIISEPLLPHCTEFIQGYHYISADINDLPKTLIYYLEHDDERYKIVENAYYLSTTELQFNHSIKRMLEAVNQLRVSR